MYLQAVIELNCEDCNNQVPDSNMQESTDVTVDSLKKRIKALLQENRNLKKKLKEIGQKRRKFSENF
jgi:hypothetical protein